MNRSTLRFAGSLIVLALFSQPVSAQSTEFTYQGRLLFGGVPANGNHDFEFRLFSDPDGSAQVGPVIPLALVNVNNGVFSVRLDFGNQFPGANRYLEIRVKQTGQEFYTVLAPRQAITSSPYAVKSLNAENAVNATQLGGVDQAEFVRTSDTRLTNPRDPLPNSPGYIQNTSSQQTNSNFNVSGNGTAGGTLSGNIVNATTQFNIGGIRVMSSASDNVSVGVGSGVVTGGHGNSFFGMTAGEFNGVGSDNSYFGRSAGFFNNGGSDNSLFGSSAGAQSRASNNSFFGKSAGELTTTGGYNSFFGVNTGITNRSGQLNTILGGYADVATDNLINAAAIGFQALVAQNNSLVLGSINGINGATADTSVGIGTSAPTSKLEVRNGEIRSTGAGGGRFAANNPNNQSARVLFDWVNDGTNDWPRIRYGGSGEGATNGFLIQGPSDITKLAILNSGNIGIGTDSPTEKLQVSGNAKVTGNLITGGTLTGSSIVAAFGTASVRIGNSGCQGTPGATPGGAIGFNALSCANYSLAGDGFNTFIKAPSGDISFRVGTTESMRILSSGKVSIATPGSAGATHLCRNSTDEISFCSSSIRYKSNINSFGSGLSLIKKLRPVSFNWKSNNSLDFGLVAEEVAEVEPLLITRNDKGDIEGVKYDRVGVVLVNAVQEQQLEIEAQQKENRQQKDLIQDQQTQIKDLQSQLQQQQTLIEDLRRLTCQSNPKAEICKEDHR
jgi:hypothetical protein